MVSCCCRQGPARIYKPLCQHLQTGGEKCRSLRYHTAWHHGAISDTYTSMAAKRTRMGVPIAGWRLRGVVSAGAEHLAVLTAASFIFTGMCSVACHHPDYLPNATSWLCSTGDGGWSKRCCLSKLLGMDDRCIISPRFWFRSTMGHCHYLHCTAWPTAGSEDAENTCLMVSFDYDWSPATDCIMVA